MIEEKIVSQTLVDEREALDVYFKALLREEVVTPAPVAEVPQASKESEALAAVSSPERTEPEWGLGVFQAMLFKVGGLTLAVPLIELSGVQEWVAEQVTPMPGHAAWYLGLVDYRGHSVPVVDTAQLVLPADRLSNLAPLSERIQRIVFIGEGRWGLACDGVAEVITLQPDQVRWRSARTQRRWLAGTVIEQMCALLDPSAFAQLLATGKGG